MIGTLIGFAQILLLALAAPLVSGATRWMRAKMQTRKGPPILQDYYDIIKLFKREDIHTKESSLIHRIMPALFTTTLLLLAMGIPTLTRGCPLPFMGDFILIIYLLALPRFFFALSAVDSGSSYAGIGGIRELIIGILCEPVMLLALFVTMLATGTTNIGFMGDAIASGAVVNPIAVTLAGIAFACACYIELGKLPYDLAEAEQELQEGPLSEYSGPSLALLKMSLSMKQIIIVSWLIAIFLPFGSAVELTLPALALGLVFYLLKVFAIFFICTIIENVVSRVRYKLLGHQTGVVFGIAAFAFVFFLLGM
ncbi:MAG: NADH-quinone oxidoreductase subunit H [Coriobacteriales bacterium]|jgi:hydrogenase-4 component C|nr:NADH-quinone oxidoreductase subunit H [Coriobacteriales bacterium]